MTIKSFATVVVKSSKSAKSFVIEMGSWGVWKSAILETNYLPANDKLMFAHVNYTTGNWPISDPEIDQFPVV